MLAAVYLLSLALAGIAVVTVLLPNAPVMVRLAGGFIAGIVVAVWVTYVVALGLSPLTDESLLAGIIVSIVVCVGVLVALVFGGTTLATMLALVAAGYAGLRMVSVQPLERWSHALAGTAVLVSGVAIQALGI